MKQICYLLLLISLSGCPNNYNYEYDIIVNNTPKNLDGLNSEYDDFNSDLPYDYDGRDIYFSTNRSRSGDNFNIIGKGLSFSYHDKDNVLDLTIHDHLIFEKQAELLFEKVNTESDDLGPFSHYFNRDLVFLYANNLSDTFKIKLVEYLNWNSSSQEAVISEPTDIPIINDVGNNLYPSYNQSASEMYFCSDRNDSIYNIYSAIYNNEISSETLLNGDIKSIEKQTVLSSIYEDKCPFIKDEIMVFTSNRVNGNGGYDLYYSFFENGKWSTPNQFDDKINTQFDEYRPILLQVFGYNLMIFSSNRPGGKGGYDLYIVNIDRIIK
jgi:hypothetical protein